MKEIKGFKDYLLTKEGDIYSKKSNKYLRLRDDREGALYARLTKSKKVKTIPMYKLYKDTFGKQMPLLLEVKNLRGEVWKPLTIQGLEKRYMFSNKGRAKSIDRGRERLLTPTYKYLMTNRQVYTFCIKNRRVEFYAEDLLKRFFGKGAR